MFKKYKTLKCCQCKHVKIKMTLNHGLVLICLKAITCALSCSHSPAFLRPSSLCTTCSRQHRACSPTKLWGNRCSTKPLDSHSCRCQDSHLCTKHQLNSGAIRWHNEHLCQG
ncbi:hypothetical protein AB205_0020470 [Aquarana catesbeiana]|uniref:Uncharacterized protein n=1 Tax=Aquarana catesbeiana TaxID=8400 RepID=A0A2G9RX36_AQUCT|nr:hypothetical protein AB205_0020470 [Aquarana catesbeiana]